MKPFAEYQPTKEQVLASSCHAIIASCQINSCEQYTEAFSKAKQECVATNDVVGETVYYLLEAVTSLYLNLEDTAAPFCPMVVMANGRSAHPDDFTDNQLNLFEELLKQEIDADLKARLADVLAIRRKLYPFGIKAIENYWLAIGRMVEQNSGDDMWGKRLERIMQLTRRMNLGPEYYQRIIGFCRGRTLAAESSAANLSEKLDETLTVLSLTDKYRMIERPELVAIAEKWGELAENEGYWPRAIFFWEYADNLTRDDTNTDKSQGVRKRLATSYEKMAVALATTNPPQMLAAAHWMLKARELLKLLKADESEQKRVDRMLSDYQAQGEFDETVLTTSIDITDIARRVQAGISGKHLHEALFALCQIAPTIKKTILHEEARKWLEQSPVAAMCSRAMMNGDGKVVAVARGLAGSAITVEDAIADEAIRTAELHRSIIVQKFLIPALSCIRSEHQYRPSDLLPLLTHTPFVPLGRELLFARGLYYGLNGDLLVAVHLLVPQVENSIRTIMEDAGAIVTKVTNHDDGVEEQKMLGALLREPKALQVFGEDLVFDLLSLLTEKYGANLRNNVAHGLLDTSQLQTMTIQYFVWLTLRLCLTPAIKAAQQQKPQSTESAVTTA